MSAALREYRSHSPEETTQAGADFAREFVRAGTITALRGELGAGKTHFVKGIARELSIDERELNSPTFALAQEYEAVQNGEPITLIHLDCYRFERPEELLALGVEDYLYPNHAATVVEWPERIEALLPENRFEVDIQVITPDSRTIQIRRVEENS